MKDFKNKMMYESYLVIIRYLKGYSNKAASEELGLCQYTEDTYIRKYKKEGFLNLNLKYSPEVLYRLNLSYTKKIYTLKKADLEKQQAFKEDFEILKMF